MYNQSNMDDQKELVSREGLSSKSSTLSPEKDLSDKKPLEQSPYEQVKPGAYVKQAVEKTPPQESLKE